MEDLRREYIIPVHLNHVELIVVICTTKRVNHVQGQPPTQIRETERGRGRINTKRNNYVYTSRFI